MDGRELKNLAGNVSRLSKLLTRDRESLPAAYLKDPDLRTAYVRYFMPANMKKVHLALSDLSLHPGRLLSKRILRILDMGAGPGTALLGLFSFFASRTGRPFLSCTAMDRVGENLRIAQDLFNQYRMGRELDAALETSRADIESASRPAGEPFDLVLFSNVLNELFPFDKDRIVRRTSLVENILRHSLAGDGSCIIIEPALRETSRELLEVRDRLVERGFNVFSPCLADMRCPASRNPRDWCHEDIPWDPPALIKDIDRHTGLRKDSLKFSYLVLRKDGRSLADMFGADSFRIVSEPLITKGKREFYICGRSGRKLVTRLDKNRTNANMHFDDLRRGAIAGFERLRDEGARFKVEQETGVVIYRHA